MACLMKWRHSQHCRKQAMTHQKDPAFFTSTIKMNENNNNLVGTLGRGGKEQGFWGDARKQPALTWDFPWPNAGRHIRPLSPVCGAGNREASNQQLEERPHQELSSPAPVPGCWWGWLGSCGRLPAYLLSVQLACLSACLFACLCVGTFPSLQFSHLTLWHLDRLFSRKKGGLAEATISATSRECFN